jgi:hypothetical protein
MATKKPAPAAAPAKANVKKINRKRRNSFERKCLSKSMKRLFQDSPRAFFRELFQTEVANKKRERVIFN